MIWKNFVSSLAIAARRRLVATAIVYGLSLAVHYTLATGKEVEISPQATVADDASQIHYRDSNSIDAQPVILRNGWSMSSVGCRTACKLSLPVSSRLSCPSR
jgi:hypothetical protein